MNTDTLAAQLLVRAQAIEFHAGRLCDALSAGDIATAERHRRALVARMQAQPTLAWLAQAYTQETDE